MASSTSASKRRQIKFSALEQRLLDLIPVDGAKVSTSTLVSRYYHDVEVPLNGRTIVRGRLNGIAAKVERAGLPFRIRKSKRAGPHPQLFWREEGA